MLKHRMPRGAWSRFAGKKIIIITSILLLAAACGKPVEISQPKPIVESISIEPSYQDGDYIMFSDGAVLKVLAQNAQSVEIKYVPQQSNEEKSLGQAISLSSQINGWALPLPKDLWTKSLWAEVRGLDGGLVKSSDLGKVRYETLNSYTSPAKYGFTINYFGDFGFDTNIEHIRALSYIPVCGEKMVGCAFLNRDDYKGTNFEAAGVSINMLNTELRQSWTDVDCYNFKVSTNEAQTQVEDVVINGVVFKSATGGGGAAGHSDRTQVYRNFHNGLCYEIAQTVAQTNIGNYPEGTVKPFNSDQVWQKLQRVVNTFKFAANATASGKVVLTGTTVCLPHRNIQPGQPQTMECAIGLLEDGTGKYYSLKNFAPSMPIFETNVKVRVTGILEDDSKSNYDVAGAINAVTWSKQ